MTNLTRRITELEKRAGKGRICNLVTWVSNPLDGSDPGPRPDVGEGDLFFEVVYVNPPSYQDEAA